MYGDFYECILYFGNHKTSVGHLRNVKKHHELKIVNWNLSPLFMEVGSRYGENAREIQERVVSATRK